MYETIIQFFTTHRIVRKDAGKWRLTKPVVGAINGLDVNGHFRGQVVATNGILCYIEGLDGTLYLGHVAWFVPDKDEDAVVDVEGKVLKAPKREKRGGLEIAQELLDSML